MVSACIQGRAPEGWIALDSAPTFLYQVHVRRPNRLEARMDPGGLRGIVANGGRWRVSVAHRRLIELLVGRRLGRRLGRIVGC